MSVKNRDTKYKHAGAMRKEARTSEGKQAVKIGRSNRVDELPLPVLPPDLL